MKNKVLQAAYEYGAAVKMMMYSRNQIVGWSGLLDGKYEGVHAFHQKRSGREHGVFYNLPNNNLFTDKNGVCEHYSHETLVRIAWGARKKFRTSLIASRITPDSPRTRSRVIAGSASKQS